MAKREKYPEITSPKGIFKFPALREPYYGTDEYPDPDGTYGVRLVLNKDSKEAKAFLAKLEPYHKEAIAHAKEEFKKLSVQARKKLGNITENPLFTELYDEETEEPTGQIEFRAKMKASGTYKKGPKEGRKWYRTPLVYDAQMNRIKDVPDVWGGTVGRISIALRPYFVSGTGAAGLQLMLLGAQIIELVEGGERSADSLGFKAEEGFTAPPETSDDDEEEDTDAF